MGSSSAMVFSASMVAVVGLKFPSSSFSLFSAFTVANAIDGCGCGYRSSRRVRAMGGVGTYSRGRRRLRLQRDDSLLGIGMSVVRASTSSEEEESSGDKGQGKPEKESSGDKRQGKPEKEVPSWAKPDSTELPPWAKNERPASEAPPLSLDSVPFPVYLIGSFLVATAAIGSIFEYFNQNPAFGVIYPDSPFYTPILGFFGITGLPTSVFLFVKSIELANKASEEADREDGARP